MRSWRLLLPATVAGAIVAAAGLLARGDGGEKGAGDTPVAAAVAGDWPHWRGPTGDGLSTEKGWFAPWPKDGPRKLWQASVGEGYSAVAIAGGRAYTMGNAGGSDTVSCLDANTGTVLWKHSYRCPTDRAYPGPRAMPTVDGDRVYTCSRKGQIFCLHAETGKVVWTAEAAAVAPGVRAPRYDFAASAVIVEDLALFNVGSAGLALDKLTGAVRWSSGKGVAGYATPVVVEREGRKMAVILASGKVLAVDPATGRRLWSHPWVASHNVDAADPVLAGDRVFVSAGYGTGCALIGFGAERPSLVWQNENLSTHVASCVLLDGHLYGFDGNIGGRGSSLRCLDLATGEVSWSERGMNGQMTAADGKLLVLTESGELVVAAASATGYKELARAQVLSGPSWTVPVLAHGRAYCRNTRGDVVCVEVTGR